VKFVVGLLAVATAVLTFTVVAGAFPRTHANVVELTIHNSHFDKTFVTVQRGAEVEYVVHNRDPIAHELIIGPADVQLRHELGTEPLHGLRPGEVSVLAGSTAFTTYRVTTNKPVQFACHLPGHYAYGMHGRVRLRGATS
jgi:uncharacterized cupredoxin-like copper-binding protein